MNDYLKRFVIGEPILDIFPEEKDSELTNVFLKIFSWIEPGIIWPLVDDTFIEFNTKLKMQIPKKLIEFIIVLFQQIQGS